MLLVESVVSYMAPKGDSEFEDLSYDGYLDGVTMRGGLGQLVDGVLGSEDFLDETSTGQSNKYVTTKHDIYII